MAGIGVELENQGARVQKVDGFDGKVVTFDESVPQTNTPPSQDPQWAQNLARTYPRNYEIVNGQLRVLTAAGSVPYDEFNGAENAGKPIGSGRPRNGKSFFMHLPEWFGK